MLHPLYPQVQAEIWATQSTSLSSKLYGQLTRLLLALKQVTSLLVCAFTAYLS